MPPMSEINFEIPEIVNNEWSNVRLIVYDVTGKLIAVLVNKELNAGYYTVDFNASNFSSGVYFYTLTANNFIQTKKMLLMK